MGRGAERRRAGLPGRQGLLQRRPPGRVEQVRGVPRRADRVGSCRPRGRGPRAPAAAGGARRERLPGLLVRLPGRGRVPLHGAGLPRRAPDAGDAREAARPRPRRPPRGRRGGASARRRRRRRDRRAEVTDLVNALLGGLLGGAEVTGATLQEEVAEAGGLPFRRDVPVAFLGREELAAYLRELFDDEYPAEQARADERLLRGLRPAAPGDGPPRPARPRARGERRGLLRRAAGQAAALRGERGPVLLADEPGRPRPRAAARPAGPVRGPRPAPRRRRLGLRRPAPRLDRRSSRGTPRW